MLSDAKQKLLRVWLMSLVVLFVAQSGSSAVDARYTHTKMMISKRLRQPKPEKRNPNYQCIRLISVQKAAKIATDFCRTSDNGAQAIYNGEYDVDVNKVRYFYFDMAYVLSKRKALRTKDISVLSLFVDSAGKAVYRVVEFKSDGKIFYVPGKRLQK
jgi:hypothetical protein